MTHFLSADMWDAMWLTLRLAFVSSLVLLVLGIPLANWLNNSRSVSHKASHKSADRKCVIGTALPQADGNRAAP